MHVEMACDVEAPPFTAACAHRRRRAQRTDSEAAARSREVLDRRPGAHRRGLELVDRRGLELVDRRGLELVDRRGLELVDRRGLELVDRRGLELVDRRGLELDTRRAALGRRREFQRRSAQG
jgi:maleate cis-trans isomerase